ncbi:superoxide dismutase [Saccharothrix sp. NRRL B-16348]|nr:superoxide dismutase [Saccharothrix sp. NRRL B-16348]
MLAAIVTPTASADVAQSSDVAQNSGVAVTVARFATPDTATKAYTYDTALIASGAAVMVVATPVRRSTKTLLSVYGLVPNRTYGAHAHQRPCGAMATDAGAHHQHVVDPNQPSVDPAYATTDDRGRAVVGAVVPWRFADRRAGSVVIHAQRTATEPGKAGTAGPRVGCATVLF